MGNYVVGKLSLRGLGICQPHLAFSTQVVLS